MATGDKEQLVAATANRLRLIQADLADEPAEVRQQYLTDEVERALGKLVPDDRPWFLEQLDGRFPTWDAQGSVSAMASDDNASRSNLDDRDLNDPGFLVERLAALAPGLTDAERSGIASRLREAGLSAAGKQVWPDQAADAACKALGLDEGAELDPVRALECLKQLVEFAASLDQLMWMTWKKLAPQSEHRKGAELMGVMGKFITGDQDVTRGEVMQATERLRQLSAAMVSAIGQAGGQYAQAHYQKFSPEHIETWARQDKGMLDTIGSACWKKYKEIFGSTDQIQIEHDIRQLVAEYAERLMKGLSR